VASESPKIAFIGFGEAAQAFTVGLRHQTTSLSIRAFDTQTDGKHADAKSKDYADHAVVGEKSSAAACQNSDLIFSLVTADQSELAAAEAAKSDLGGAFYLDCNSCAPETKRRSAAMIDAAGGRYIDVAVMTPVHPNLHKSPCLFAGPHATEAQEITTRLGMTSQVSGEIVGDASVRKMIRSVMIKGLEALTLECFLAARKAGIEEDILSSLDSSFKSFDWRERAPYMMERAMTHGTRRAAEMQESAKTLRDLGISPTMTDATVLRQQELGALHLDATVIGADNVAALGDAILEKLNGVDKNKLEAK